MGDLNAAEYCAEAHSKVLRAMGSFSLDCALLNGRPPPRGGHLEALVIDDHFGCAVDAPGSTYNADLLKASFDAAQTAYLQAGPSRSQKKARRAVDSGVFLGAESSGGLSSSARSGFEVVIWRGLASRSYVAAAHLAATSAGFWRLGYRCAFKDAQFSH